MKSVLILILALPSLGWSESSIWQIAKQKSNSMEGIIKAIVVDEDQKQILLKVETDQSELKTVQVCAQDLGNDFRNFEQSEKMAFMRQAFARGDRVQVSFNGPFDRCLSQINYTANHKNQAESKNL